MPRVSKKNPFNLIDKNILAYIFKFLSWPDLVYCRQLCKRFRRIANSTSEWKSIRREQLSMKEHGCLTVEKVMKTLAKFPPQTPVVYLQNCDSFFAGKYRPKIYYCPRNVWSVNQSGVIAFKDCKWHVNIMQKSTIEEDGRFIKDTFPVVCIN